MIIATRPTKTHAQLRQSTRTAIDAEFVDIPQARTEPLPPLITWGDLMAYHGPFNKPKPVPVRTPEERRKEAFYNCCAVMGSIMPIEDAINLSSLPQDNEACGEPWHPAALIYRVQRAIQKLKSGVGLTGNECDFDPALDSAGEPARAQ